MKRYEDMDYEERLAYDRPVYPNDPNLVKNLAPVGHIVRMSWIGAVYRSSEDLRRVTDGVHVGIGNPKVCGTCWNAWPCPIARERGWR